MQQIRPRALLLIATTLATAACSSSPSAHDAHAPTDSGGSPGLTAPGRHAVFVPGDGGTRLATEVWLPDAARTGKVHTVLRLTRYWRATAYLDPAAAAADPDEQLAGFYLSQGLAVVAVDARGTGASFGTNPGPWSTSEQADAARVLDWIVAQPWSSGRVSTIGVSYDGNSALLLAAQKHPALAAVAARFIDYDPYAGIAFPGGLRNAGFDEAWSAYTHALDVADLCALAAMRGQSCDALKATLAGPRPVDPARLGAALAEHAGNLDLASALRAVVYRDDALGAGQSLEGVSPFRHNAAFDASGVPVLVTAGWLDAGTAAGALDGFAQRTGPQTVVIGAFSHGGLHDSDPLRAPRPTADPPIDAQYGEALGFLLSHASATGPVARTIRYATLGDDTWRTTPSWPPASVKPRTLHLAPGGALSDAATGKPAQDAYVVDATVTTGARNRWLTPIDGSPVEYGDRAGADARLLTYTSEPLAADLRVTGTPVVRLRMSADVDDAAVIVYLEVVDAAGVSRYVTEGELRLLHRAGGPGEAGSERVTGRTYRRDAARPYHAGDVVDLVIPMQPTSAKLPAGSRIRLAIAGADAGTFAPVTPGGARFTIHRGDGASTFELPVDGAR